MFVICSNWHKQVWHCRQLVKSFRVKTSSEHEKRNAHPRVVHSDSSWEGLLCCRCWCDPGSTGQESTELALVPSLLSSRSSWWRISLRMSALTSELLSQPCACVSGLRRDTKRKSAADRKGALAQDDRVLYGALTWIHHIFENVDKLLINGFWSRMELVEQCL